MSILKIRDENGSFIGITSIKGDKGDKGQDGAIQYTAGTNIEITPDNVINCTAGEVEENDPTVPNHVKAITETDITNWNNKSEFTGSYNDLSDKPSIPSKTSEITNDSDFTTNNYINELFNPEIIEARLITNVEASTTTEGVLSLTETKKTNTNLAVSNGKIVIPDGIKYVLVSGSLVFTNKTQNAVSIQGYIKRFDSLGSEQQNDRKLGRERLLSLDISVVSIPMTLMEVNAGDTIALGWWKGTTDSVTITKSASSRLTVVGIKEGVING